MAALSVQATAKGTLLPQGKFFCRADTIVACDNSGNCTKSNSRLSGVVDFANGTFANLSMETKPKPLLNVDAQGDVLVFSTYIGNVFTITERPSDIETAYGFKAVIFLGVPVLHFGSCNRI